MKRTGTFIAIYDVWCVLALAMLPSIFMNHSLTAQIINYVLITGISYWWLKDFLKANKTVGRFYQLSYYLRNVTMILPIISLLVSVVMKLVQGTVNN